jgi:drug/metabolite transporter (DMT)-like permease
MAATEEWTMGAASPVRAALWMSTAAALFTGMVVCVRLLTDTMSVFEINFFRALIGLIAMGPVLVRGGLGRMRTTKLPLYLLRVLSGYAGMICFYSALAHLDLVSASTLNTTAPLFGVFFAWLILREKVGARRAGLAALGFVGALIIVRPGVATLNEWSLVALGSAALYATTSMMIKLLSNTEPATRLIFYMNLLFVPISLPLALVFWVTPTWADAPYILGVGLCATTAHYCFARACQAADASFVVPFDFLRLPFAAVAGFLLFATIPDLWTVIGALVIFFSIVLLARTEARRTIEQAVVATPDPVEASPVEDELPEP